MPELLRPTSAIVGYGLSGKVFLNRWSFFGWFGRFYYWSLSPESFDKGLFGSSKWRYYKIMQRNNKINYKKKIFNFCWDKIYDNKIKNKNNEDIELNTPYLMKYRKLVQPAEKGCVTN